MTNSKNIISAAGILISLFLLIFGGVYYVTDLLYPAMAKAETKQENTKSGSIVHAQGRIITNDHVPLAVDTAPPTVTVVVPADADNTTDPVRVSFAASDRTNAASDYESGLDCSTLRLEVDDDGNPGFDYAFGASTICGGMTANLANAPYPVGRIIHLQASVKDKVGNFGNSQFISFIISNGQVKLLSVNANANGTINGNLGQLTNCTNSNGICWAEYATGDTVTLTATPNKGYIVSGWGGACGHLGKGDTTCTLTLDKAQAVDVFFNPAIAPPLRQYRYDKPEPKKIFGAHQTKNTIPNAESTAHN